VEQQPHATPDLLEAEADAMADGAPSPAPAEGSAPHYRRYEDDNAIPASAPRAPLAPPIAHGALLALGHDLSRIPIDSRAKPFAIQTKLTVNKPGDEFEQEADRVAEQVMRQPAGEPRHTCECGGTCDECKRKKLPASETAPTAVLQRKTAHETAPGLAIQTRSFDSNRAAGKVPPMVHSTLSAPGRPLEHRTRTFMESRFGVDFSSIQIHTDAAAARSARAVGARAYTVGRDIVFGSGEFAPESSAGLCLLAHELVHTIQQAGSPARLLQRKDGDPLEEIANAGASDSSIRQIVIDPGSRRTRFYTVGGKTYDGKLTMLASGFKEGDYLLERDTSGDANKTWKIFNTDGSIYHGGLQFDVFLDGVDFGSLGYIGRVSLKLASGLLPKLIDIEAKIKEIKDALINKATDPVIVGLFENIPPEQAADFVKRLREEKFGDTPLLEKLDQYVDGEDNIKLHQVLSRLKLQAGGSKTAAALADAPSLAWHDVMGFFEQKAVFSVTPSGNGKYRIRYLGGISGGLYSAPEYSEIKSMGKKERLNIMTGSGIEVDADQPIIVHDYDNDRQVVLTAEDLIAYQHAGVRKFLQDVATVASLATPVGAESVGARVLAYGVQIATVATVIVDENKLNIKKWFPKWGPAIIDISEKIKIGIAIVGVAQLVHGGWTLFTKLRQLRAARAAMDAKAIVSNAEELARAEKQAAQLEANADKLLAQADLARKELGLVEEAAATGQKAEGSVVEGGTKGGAAANIPEVQPAAPPVVTPRAAKSSIIEGAIGKGEFTGEFATLADRELAEAAKNPSRMRPSKMPGYSVEVPIEGTDHFLARKAGGGWCLFSGTAKGCGVIAVAQTVDQVFEEAGRELAQLESVDASAAYEAMYKSIKQGSADVKALGKDAEAVKIVGDVSKMSGPAGKELKTAFGQVNKIVEIGKGKKMPDDMVLAYVKRLAEQRSGGPGVAEAILDEMKAWKKPTEEQVQALSKLEKEQSLLSTIIEERAEVEAEIKAGPKTAEGKPDTARVDVLRQKKAGLDREVSVQAGIVGSAEETAERAAVDPKELMRNAFKNSAERENVIAGATGDAVGKVGGGAGLKTPPTGVTIDHIVSIDQISEMEGFQKLRPAERKMLAVRQDNLIAMDASANFSKGRRPWSAWKQASTYYDDATKQAMLADEAKLRTTIQNWIKEQVKGR